MTGAFLFVGALAFLYGFLGAITLALALRPNGTNAREHFNQMFGLEG